MWIKTKMKNLILIKLMKVNNNNYNNNIKA